MGRRWMALLLRLVPVLLPLRRRWRPKVARCVYTRTHTQLEWQRERERERVAHRGTEACALPWQSCARTCRLSELGRLGVESIGAMRAAVFFSFPPCGRGVCATQAEGRRGRRDGAMTTAGGSGAPEPGDAVVQYLGALGFEAASSEEWRGRGPNVVIRVTGHTTSGAHTLYHLDCELQPSGGARREAPGITSLPPEPRLHICARACSLDAPGVP